MKAGKIIEFATLTALTLVFVIIGAGLLIGGAAFADRFLGGM